MAGHLLDLGGRRVDAGVNGGNPGARPRRVVNDERWPEIPWAPCMVTELETPIVERRAGSTTLFPSTSSLRHFTTTT